MFEYPHQIPTHHTVDDLPADELQELDKRIEAKAKQEKGKKGKAKKKTKPETSEKGSQKGEPQLQIPVVEPQKVDRNIQPETPPQTPTIPREDRRNNRNDDDEVRIEIITGLLETFPNLREKVNNHIHTSWNLRITW